MLRLIPFILFNISIFAQVNFQNPAWFKGDHFVAYNKCGKAVIFCENTQQDYTFCGAFINCQGLYVNPGDTFYLNYEDKWQSKRIVADVFFQGYLSTILSHTFEPVINCLPPKAIQIIIPISASPSSSFQITVQNATYDPPESNIPNIPYPFLIYVGGQPAPNTVPLADFTSCDISQQEDTSTVDVSVEEIYSDRHFYVYPIPAIGILNFEFASEDPNRRVKIFNMFGEHVLTIDASKGQMILNISNLEKGVYYYEIDSEGRILKTSKIVIN